MGATTVWSREEVAARILAGEHLIVYNSHLLRIPHRWLEAHPGGALAILHFVGRDAADEIEAYHTDATLKLITAFAIGRVELKENVWAPLVPPVMTGWVRKLAVDGQSLTWVREASAQLSPVNTQVSPSSQILLVQGDDASVGQSQPDLATLEPPPTDLSLIRQAQHSRAYKQLHKRIIDADLYKTPYLTGYGPEILRYLLLACLAAYTYREGWFITSAVFLGLMWHQLVFSAHDLGHMGVTHNWTVDRLLSIFIADFIGGLSIGWWVEVRRRSQPSSRCLKVYIVPES